MKRVQCLPLAPLGMKRGGPSICIAEEVSSLTERRLGRRTTWGDVRVDWGCCELDIARFRVRTARGEAPFRSRGGVPVPVPFPLSVRVRGAKSPEIQSVSAASEKARKRESPYLAD
jgi:hypothetical protein